MSRTHVHRLRVTFGDCDPAEIVYFPNYFRWFDTAGREFFTACGIPGWQVTKATRGIIGTPLVDVQASFKAPATYGEDIEITTWIEEWRTKSFVFRHVARRGDTVLCESTEIRVFVIQDPDRPGGIKAIPIPEDIRAACE